MVDFRHAVREEGMRDLCARKAAADDKHACMFLAGNFRKDVWRKVRVDECVCGAA